MNISYRRGIPNTQPSYIAIAIPDPGWLFRSCTYLQGTIANSHAAMTDETTIYSYWRWKSKRRLEEQSISVWLGLTIWWTKWQTRHSGNNPLKISRMTQWKCREQHHLFREQQVDMVPVIGAKIKHKILVKLLRMAIFWVIWIWVLGTGRLPLLNNKTLGNKISS